MQEFSSMRPRFWLLVLFLAFGLSVHASDDSEPKPQGSGSSVGYVVCSDRSEQFASMLLNVCQKLPAGRIGCGQTVSVLQRRGDWLEITLADRRSRYLSASVVSRSADKFVPFDTDSGITDKGAVDCPVPPVPPPPRELGPRAIYAPQPEYSETARKKKISGTVVLSLVVGLDGLPHDIRVEKKLGFGLDEKALGAVQQWEFQPATKDGQPFEKQIHVTTTFRLF